MAPQPPIYEALLAYLAADGGVHTLESLERLMVQRGYPLRESCRVGLICETAANPPPPEKPGQPKPEKLLTHTIEGPKGQRRDCYQITPAGRRHLEQFRREQAERIAAQQHASASVPVPAVPAAPVRVQKTFF